MFLHRFKCCLPSYKFHKKLSDHKQSHPKPHKPAKIVHHDIKPVASVQRVPIPKLFALPSPTEAPAQEPQQSPYAGYQYQDAASPVAPTAGTKEFQSEKSSIMNQNLNIMDQN